TSQRSRRRSRLRCSGAPAWPAGRRTSSSRRRQAVSSGPRRVTWGPQNASSTDVELTSYRDRFPILEHTTYLINHSLGAMPAAAEERLLEYARTWRERGIRAWAEGWWELPLTVGDQIGRIIGAPPGSTVMHQNVAIAEAI